MNFDPNRYQFYTTGNKVIAVSTYAGRTVRGVAKCDPRDIFDLDYGRQLAAARCNEKVAAKRRCRADQKLTEAEHLLDEALQHYKNMKSYYTDADNAYRDAIENTNVLTDLC